MTVKHKKAAEAEDTRTKLRARTGRIHNIHNNKAVTGQVTRRRVETVGEERRSPQTSRATRNYEKDGVVEETGRK